jgi:hypothetical protein
MIINLFRRVREERAWRLSREKTSHLDRAAQGLQWLNTQDQWSRDALNPDRINIRTLNVADGVRCPLAQAAGMGYSRAMVLGISPPGEVHAYGFCSWYGDDPEVLNAAWRRVLRADRQRRRDSAAEARS